jgi:hypothetical protein
LSKLPTYLEYAGIALMVAVVCCCCCSVGLYLAFTYITSGMKTKKQAPGPRKVKSKRPKVGSSRAGELDEDVGVSMSKLLTAADLEDRIAEIKSERSS